MDHGPVEGQSAKGCRSRGFFVAFSYTADAEAEAVAFWKRTRRKITLITVREILDELHVQRL